MVKNVDSSVKFLMYPRFLQVFLDKQVGDMSTHNRTYDAPYHTKKNFANMKKEGKGFSRKVTPLFQTMMVQAQKEMGEGSDMPTDPYYIPIITQPSTSQPKKKQKPRKSMKQNTKVSQLSGSTTDAADENVPTHSNDPLLSSKDRLQLKELLEHCTKLSERVLHLETAKTAQAKEIASLKKKVKQLQKKKRSRTHMLKRLRKVGSARMVESSNEVSLGDQEDASKQGRKIADIDVDAEVTMIDETQGRNNYNLMFDASVLDNEQDMAEKEVDVVEKEISTVKPVTTAGEVVTTASVEATTVSATTTTAKDKGKAKMVETENPLKKKDHIIYDQEVALNLQAQLQSELEEEKRLAR
ncbi:hypothetical protein Tco_0892298 [Tanacetum coccineum]|uniref:Uncharacterized protein n=1 Tax=Tanacetum coccineum TaxID=301880 RepID=A0ABQ5C5T2_9ASTR